MSERDDTVYLRHILDAIDRATRHVYGITGEAFMADEKTQDAVVRQLEIIGEAARNVSDGFRAANSEIPWADVVGMRNRLIHEYFGVNLEVVWDTVRESLPSLRALVQEALSPGGSADAEQT